MAVSKRLRFEILTRDNHTCRYCGRTAPEVKLTVDHVLPVALGGPDAADNLWTACEDCNAGKSSVPPGAAKVASVSADAARWAEAVKAAANSMLSDYQARAHNHAQFAQAWNNYTIGGESLSLEPGWEQSVDQFVSRGLPMPILLECVGIAFARYNTKRFAVSDVFRYMCGVAHRKLDKLQMEAKTYFTGGSQQRSDAGKDAPSLQPDLLTDFLEQLGFTEDTGEFKEFNHYVARRRESTYEDAEVEALWGLVSFLHDEYSTFVYATEDLKDYIPEDSKSQISHDIDMTAVKLGNKQMSTAQWNSEFVRAICGRLAYQGLMALPAGEGSEWLQGHLNRASEDVPIWYTIMGAFDYRARLLRGQCPPQDRCQARGKHGAMCPDFVTRAVSFTDCPWCKESCDFKHSLCEYHLEQGITGILHSYKGVVLELGDFRDFTQDDEWGAPF